MSCVVVGGVSVRTLYTTLMRRQKNKEDQLSQPSEDSEVRLDADKATRGSRKRV